MRAIMGDPAQVSWLLLFAEGFATFVSPCILPMLPVYLIYLGGEQSEGRYWRRLRNAVAFVLGFTVIFTLLGMGASALGQFLQEHMIWLQRIGGVILIVFGLQFLGVFRIAFLNREVKPEYQVKDGGFFSSMLFGAAFSLGWGPCSGPLLGAALMTASQAGGLLRGGVMLFVYAMGLGLPFIVVAMLMERLKGLLDWFKKHQRRIQQICGVLLIVVGIAFLTDAYSWYASLFN